MLNSGHMSKMTSLRTRSFSDHRPVTLNLIRKDIVKIFSGNLEGFMVQPLFLSLLGYKSQSSFMFSSMSFPFCKIL